MSSPQEERLAYLEEILTMYQPDLVGITEFKESALDKDFSALSSKFGYAIDFEPAISYEGDWEGIVVLAKGKTKITRLSPWPKITKRLFGARADHRQAVRCERNGFTVYFGHITHPHEHPRLSARRTEEWAQYRAMLEKEKNPYAWFADTNTTLARTVQKRLGDVALLGHDRRTWGYRPVKDRTIGPINIQATRIQFSRALYLDRCAVRPDLARLVSLTVIPSVFNGQKCPSDHLPILMAADQD